MRTRDLARTSKPYVTLGSLQAEKARGEYDGVLRTRQPPLVQVVRVCQRAASCFAQEAE